MIFAKRSHTLVFAGGILILGLLFGSERVTDILTDGFEREEASVDETETESETPPQPVEEADEPEIDMPDDDEIVTDWVEPDLIGEPTLSTDPDALDGSPAPPSGPAGEIGPPPPPAEIEPVPYNDGFVEFE